jgi:2,3-dihydroxy-p-cumate/2,3-dihydroxybenzoate 3,4-dioxygenase
MIRYEKLGYVELMVTDMERSRDFYENIIGLQYVGTGVNGELRFRCGDDPYNVVLHQGEEPGHKRTGWKIEGEDEFESLKSSLQANNVAYEVLSNSECGDRGFSYAVRFLEPNTKAVIEIYANETPAEHYHFKPTLAKIQRLGHVVFTTPKRAEAVAFYKDVLNFAESDTIGEIFTFMRPWPNPYHHGVGIGSKPNTVYHHTNFMVTEIDDIGKAIHRLNAAGFPIVHGPGRHPASGSVFLYFLDPDGLTCEYSFGMEEFHENFERPPRVIPLRKDAGDSWGAPMDPRMGATGLIEPYKIS